MNEKKDGGQAFPRPYSERELHRDFGIPAQNGMTLRDYFAAAALQGYCYLKGGQSDPQKTAAWAYQQADAMIEEREATSGN